MSLLKLSDVGKIYVSGDSVAVGIRGVNLEFDIGEFVAVTGKSGSGKTTLLNIISGMDTYEEGELYIEGESTSHFDQSDWEEYRQKYISFIFQDYNIIESFTVLQNVELALSGYSPKERHRRALELIERVGLTNFKNHKGSKLSGGQKQRTVIARALAKDSPIILADEPTGNLDSQTSKEIIELLAEISKEKLVIVVTHNFDEVAGSATREIRIFDGAVERDEVLRAAPISEYVPKKTDENGKHGVLRQGLELGFFRFFAMPKLSIFTCIIMVIAMLGSFFATAILFQGSSLFEKNYIMTHVSGRVAVSPQDGSPVSEEKIKELAEKTGASSYIVYDKILDSSITYFSDPMHGTIFSFVVDDDMRPSVGRRPEAVDEAMLYLPIGMQGIFGKHEILVPTLDVFQGSYRFKIVGLKYYYDNNRPHSDIVITRESFSEMSKYSYIFSNANLGIEGGFELAASVGTATIDKFKLWDYINLTVDPSLSGHEIYFANTDGTMIEGKSTSIFLDAALESEDIREYAFVINISPYGNYGGTGSEGLSYVLTASSSTLLTEKRSYGNGVELMLCISPELAGEMSAQMMENYSQSSLFFENDRVAERKIVEIRELGYNAVSSNWTHTTELERILNAIMLTATLLLWLAVITFVAFFISICTSRAIIAKIGDVAILRSMGIKVKVIKMAQYVQMAMSSVPAIFALVATALVMFLTPALNALLPYLYFYEYALIVLGVLIIAFRMTRRNNKKMFRGSVRKTLRHNAEDDV